MTSAERQQLHKAISLSRERAEIREAITASAVQTSIDRLLGDELIAAAREVVAAWHDYRFANGRERLRNSEARMVAAIGKVEELVGRP